MIKQVKTCLNKFRRGNPKVVVMAVTTARQSRNGQIKGKEPG